MALYDRILEEMEAIGSHEEAAAACEGIVDDVAKQFVKWYEDNSFYSWAREMSMDEMYEHFKRSL